VSFQSEAGFRHVDPAEDHWLYWVRGPRQALAFSLTGTATAAKYNKARSFHNLRFSSIFKCCKLYENKLTS